MTDPAHPVKTGEWVPPFSSKLPWASYLYSAHEAAAKKRVTPKRKMEGE